MATRARTRTKKARRDRPRPSALAARGLAVALAIGALIFVLLRLYDGVPTVDYVTQNVSVPTVGNLLAHDFVRIGGRRVGQVADVGVGRDGRPRVKLQLSPGTKLPADTTVAIRANGLLGARYVELIPGRSGEMLPPNSTIRGGANAYSYGLPEALETFDDETRGGLGDAIDNLGTGTFGRGAGLNQTLRDLNLGAGQFRDVGAAILRREGAAERLIPSMASATTALDHTTPLVPEFLDATGDAVLPFVAERAATQATLSAAPETLSTADTGLRKGVALLRSVRRFSSAAATSLPSAPRAFAATSTLLDEGRRPLRRLAPIVRDELVPAADSATNASMALGTLAPRLQEGLTRLGPIFDYVGRYGCDVANSVASIRSLTGFAQAGQGIQGKAMAFRILAVAPGLLEGAGVKDPSPFVRRNAYEAPCKYLSRPYPQYDGTTNGGAD